MRIIKNAVLAVVLSIATIAASSAPAVSAERISRGDAQAVFQSFWTAFTIQSHTSITAPALADASRINLTIDDDGVHICTLDWHTYGIGWGVVGTLQDAIAEEALLDIDFLIDGQPVESDVTAIRSVNTETGVILYGGLIEPGSLEIGAQTLTTNFYYDGTFESVTVTFYVDAEGTGDCL